MAFVLDLLNSRYYWNTLLEMARGKVVVSTKEKLRLELSANHQKQCWRFEIECYHTGRSIS